MSQIKVFKIEARYLTMTLTLIQMSMISKSTRNSEIETPTFDLRYIFIKVTLEGHLEVDVFDNDHDFKPFLKTLLSSATYLVVMIFNLPWLRQTALSIFRE